VFIELISIDYMGEIVLEDYVNINFSFKLKSLAIPSNPPIIT